TPIRRCARRNSSFSRKAVASRTPTPAVFSPRRSARRRAASSLTWGASTTPPPPPSPSSCSSAGPSCAPAATSASPACTTAPQRATVAPLLRRLARLLRVQIHALQRLHQRRNRLLRPAHDHRLPIGHPALQAPRVVRLPHETQRQPLALRRIKPDLIMHLRPR